MNEEQVLEAITRGTTSHDRRHDPKVIRVRHIEETFAIVEWRGSTYSCSGCPCYVPGHAILVRNPTDMNCSGGLVIWSTARDEDGTLTPKRLRVWLELFREAYVHYIDWDERFSSMNRRLLNELREKVKSHLKKT